MHRRPNAGVDGAPVEDRQERGRRQVEALRRQLERTSNLERLIHVVNAREEADLFLEIVATDYGTPLDRLRRPIVVVRLLDRGQTYTTDFFGQYTDVLRPEAYGAAKQIEAWIEANYDVLQRVIAGPPG